MYYLFKGNCFICMIENAYFKTFEVVLLFIALFSRTLSIVIFTMADARGGCLMVFKILSSCLEIIFSCLTFPVFSFLYFNLHAGLWSFLSIIQSSMVLHLHLLYKSYRLETWHTPHSLAATRDLGILTILGGVGGTTYYIYTAVTYQVREGDNIA